MTAPVSPIRTRSRAGRAPRGASGEVPALEARATDALGVVFCGGASRRMGRDKARLILEGRSLLARALATLDEVAPRVVLACGSEPRQPELGRECVLDAEPGAGPLAGLAAALAHAEHVGLARVCVLACDMPFAGPGVFRTLLARSADSDVCLLATPAGPEPLCGVYHVRVLARVRAALARGARRMDAFHSEVRVRCVPEAELAPGCARNLNTPEDYRAAGGEA